MAFFPQNTTRIQPTTGFLKPKVDQTALLQMNQQRKIENQKAGALKAQLLLQAAELEDQKAFRQQKLEMEQQASQAALGQQQFQNQIAARNMQINEQQLAMQQEKQQFELNEARKKQALQTQMQKAFKSGDMEQYMGLLEANDPKAAQEMKTEMLKQKKIMGQIYKDDIETQMKMTEYKAGLTAALAGLPEEEGRKYFEQHSDEYAKAGIFEYPSKAAIAASQVLLAESKGKDNGLSPTTRTFIEKELYEDIKSMKGVQNLIQEFNPDYFTVEGRATAAGTKFLKSLGLEVSKEGTINMANREAFMAQARQLFNEYKSRITGAQASIQEMNFLKDSLLNFDTFVPEVFLSQLQLMDRNLQAQMRMKQEILDAGINPFSPEGMEMMEEKTARYAEQQKAERGKQQTPTQIDNSKQSSPATQQFPNFGQFIPGA